MRAERQGKADPSKRGFFDRTHGKFTPGVVERSSHPVIGSHFTRIDRRFGKPSHGFAIMPRPTSAFSLAVSSGTTSFLLGVHHRVPTTFVSRKVVFVSFYSPWYFDDPFYTGFWYPGWYPSIYTYYGWGPRWCRPPSLIVYDYDPYPIYVSRTPYYTPYYYSERTRLDVAGVDTAMSDIRRAWLDSDADRLAGYLRDDRKTAVYFDGKYAYSLSADDYYRMTLDAMSTIRTEGLVFNDPQWITATEVRFTGRHIFYNMDDERESVYVAYRLHRYGRDWYIIAVDSSPKPLGGGDRY